MSFEVQDMKGMLFPNKRKNKESHPDFNGEIKVQGSLWDISAWVHENKNGEKYLSISVKPPWRDPTKGVGAQHVEKREQGTGGGLFS